MGRVKTRSLKKSVCRVCIKPLPSSLLAQWQGYNRSVTKKVLLVAFVRHRFTNYDHLRRHYRLQGGKLDSFRKSVNEQVRRAIDTWYAVHRPEHVIR
jgi:hypothetical protein